MTEENLRNEILIADDEADMRAKVVSAVREVFANLTIHEAEAAFPARRILREHGQHIVLVVSDGMMGGDAQAGRDVTMALVLRGCRILLFIQQLQTFCAEHSSQTG